MDGCIEVAGSKNTTYFIKDSVNVATRVISTEHGKTVERWYNQDGKLHRKDLPAEIRYYKNGQKHLEYYYKNGELHRKNLPAEIRYYTNGQKLDYWYKNGKLYQNGDKQTAADCPKSQEPSISILAQISVEDRLAKLEATTAKLAAALVEKQ